MSYREEGGSIWFEKKNYLRSCVTNKPYILNTKRGYRHAAHAAKAFAMESSSITKMPYKEKKLSPRIKQCALEYTFFLT